jgi:hypothetical protein
MVMDPTNDIDCINSVSVGPDTMNNLSLRASYMDSTDNDNQLFAGILIEI